MFSLEKNARRDFTKVLNERESLFRTLHRFQMKKNARRKNYEREYEIIRTRSY